MNKIFLLLLSICILGCQKKSYNYSYNFVMESSSNKFIQTHKFISYKNYLIEFVTVINTDNNILKIEHNCIYIIPKNESKIYKLDSFYKDCKVIDTLQYNKKAKGIILNDLDKSTLEAYNKFFVRCRDTIIDNLYGKVIDTSDNSIENKHLDIKIFFIEKKNLNTVLNIQDHVYEKKIFPYTYAGTLAYHNKEKLLSIFIKDLKELTDEEKNICEKMIEKIKAYKGK